MHASGEVHRPAAKRRLNPEVGTELVRPDVLEERGLLGGWSVRLLHDLGQHRPEAIRMAQLEREVDRSVVILHIDAGHELLLLKHALLDHLDLLLQSLQLLLALA